MKWKLATYEPEPPAESAAVTRAKSYWMGALVEFTRGEHRGEVGWVGDVLEAGGRVRFVVRTDAGRLLAGGPRSIRLVLPPG
jgi:hypothetical protein